MTARVLVVDDEAGIRKLVTAYLEAEGYTVQTLTEGSGVVAAVRSFRPDVVVLDVMLPGQDGLTALAQLRRESAVYVILLTARAEETDKLVGLTVGADDYVTKPFSPRELVARVKSALRRLQPGKLAEETSWQFGALRIDEAGRRVWVADDEVTLTTVEFELLLALARHAGRVLTREQLLQQVWGHDFYGEVRVVDVHVGHIRQKLGADHVISTVRGVGYRFEIEGV